MIEVKTLGGGLNKDDSQYRLPPNDYVDANNITHDAVEGSNDQIITPIIANRLVPYTYHSGGTPKTIGSYANTLRNTIIEFAYHPTGYHSIIEFNATTRVRSKIFENLTDSDDVDVLGFLPNKKITSIDVYNRDEGDLLFFLDSLGRPTGLDIELFRQGEYTPVTRAILDKAKKPPLSPPSAIYGNDTTIRSNNLRKRLFRFSYRWVYDDFEKSTFSPISIVPLPVGIISDTYTNVITNNNVINLIASTGDKNVKSVEIAMSFVEKSNDWSDFQSIGVFKKSELSLTQKTVESIGDPISIEATTFTGTVTAGTIVNVYLTLLPNTETLVGTYTVSTGDTLDDVATGLAASMITIGITLSPFSYLNNVVYVFLNTTYVFSRVEILLANADNDNVSFGVSFYNDSTYPNIPVEEGPIVTLFDYVPPKANAQAMPNGNILAYIGITEGYDKDTIESSIITVDTIAAGNNAVGSLNGVVTFTLPPPASTEVIRILFSGTPATGTVISVRLKNITTQAIVVVATYTTVPGDTIGNATTGIIGGLITSALGLGLVINAQNPALNTLGISYFAESSSSSPHYYSDYADLVIIAPTSSVVVNSIATWKWSTGRSIGRVYFDEKGVTNGVLYSDKVTFPAYAENGSQLPLIPFINYKINDIPPDWAYSMQFVMTKENTQYIFWESLLVDKNEAAYIYFEVTSFIVNASKKPTTAAVLSYTFQDGDRMRIIRDTDIPGIVLDYTYDAAIEGLVVDPVINTVATTGGREFIKIKNIEPFTSGISGLKNYIIELYRPSQQSANSDNQTYYEFGQQYAIIDPTLPTRRHSGVVTNQVVGLTPAEFNFYEGDAYFRSRTIATKEAPGSAGYATFNVMDRNFVDFYISAVSSVDGRPNIIDLNARRAYYSTLIRHGEAYQANTNINGLNRFYSQNFDEYDISKGDALALEVKNKQLIVFQKFKIGNVPLFSSIGKDPNGLTVVFNTDKLLNPIQYYAGDFGIGTCPESIASFNFAIYGCDNIKGIIWRLSNDGLIKISEKYKMNSWANDNLPLRKDDVKIYGAFDQRLDNYITALEGIVCVGVEVPDFTLNDATQDVDFSQTVTVTGSLSFTLENIIAPDWMTISISGYDIVFSGNPAQIDVGNDNPVSFDISNDCGLVSVSKTINVITPPCVPIAIVGTPVLPNGAVGTPYSYSIALTGSQLYVISFTTKPGWMTIAIVGSDIVFSGTPDAPGSSIPVEVIVGNGCGSVDFTDSVDVTLENWFISNTNNDSSIDLEVRVGNNGASPSSLLYTGTYSTDPLSGIDLVNLPAVNLNARLELITGEIIISCSCNGVAGLAGGSSVTWIGINGGPLIISFVV